MFGKGVYFADVRNHHVVYLLSSYTDFVDAQMMSKVSMVPCPTFFTVLTGFAIVSELLLFPVCPSSLIQPTGH